MGKGLSASPLGLDLGGELSQWIGETFAGCDLSVSVRGGDSQFEGSSAELWQSIEELCPELLLRRGVNFMKRILLHISVNRVRCWFVEGWK